jgi:nicotinamidase/pyrazinamidase
VAARDVHGSGLAEWLRARHVTDVDVCGIATDHCVKATALDAAAAGFRTRVLSRLCAGVAPETTAAALDQLRGAGVVLA